MYNTLAEPHGSGNLLENDDSIYAEKFCLSGTNVDTSWPEQFAKLADLICNNIKKIWASRGMCQEDEIFILHVQKKISIEAIGIETANSITGCLQHCLDMRRCKVQATVQEREGGGGRKGPVLKAIISMTTQTDSMEL